MARKTPCEREQARAAFLLDMLVTGAPAYIDTWWFVELLGRSRFSRLFAITCT